MQVKQIQAKNANLLLNSRHKNNENAKVKGKSAD